MEKRDIRLYYYEPGQLMKIGYTSNKGHKFKTLEECVEYVDRLKISKPKSWGQKQFVITEYTGSYSSKIIQTL